MVSNILFLPDFEIFKKVKNAVDKDEKNCISYQVFRKCMLFYVDTQNRLIYISPEMKGELIKNKLIPNKIKRLSLYQILSVHNEKVSGDYQVSLLRLASILAIDTNKRIYVICDDIDMRNKINERSKLFKCISSETALELIDNIKSD